MIPPVCDTHRYRAVAMAGAEEILRLLAITALLLTLVRAESGALPRKGLRAAPLHAVISGVVLDGSSHQPIENATVRIVNSSFHSFTDAQGRFAFPPVEPGEFSIEVTRIGYRKSVLTTRVIEDLETPVLYIHLFPLPIQGAAVVITGEHPNRRLSDLVETATVMRGKELQREIGQTLAATLRNETGLAIRSMGPAPARPVIRGLGGDRIVIAEDGVRTADLSSTSPDHAVTVEPFTVERIEVLRGPKVLLRSSTTLGGIVNIIREEIPEALPTAVSGSVGLFGESSSRGVLGSATTVVPLDPFVLRGEVSRKNAMDLRTPVGTLTNSYGDVTNISAGASVAGAWGFAGASFREYDTRYGVPGGFVGAHPRGVDITMFRRQISARGSHGVRNGSVEGIDWELNRTYYHHVEYEKSGLIGAEFLTHTVAGRAAVRHTALGMLQEGTAGISVEARDFSVGGFVFTPASTSLNAAAFLLESLTFGDLEIQGAVRFGFDRLAPEKEDLAARIGPIRTRTFTTWSASGSLLYDVGSGIFTGMTISRSSRVPTLEELYSEGPHLAAYSYEVGNPGLDAEHGLGGEIFVFLKHPSLYVMATAFHYELPSYIISQNSGKLNFTTLLPTYVATGVRAGLSGIETQVEWVPCTGISLQGSCSYTHAANRSSGFPLPAIPPLKVLVEVKYSTHLVAVGLSAEGAAAQNRIDEFELPTAGYGIVNSYVQLTLPTGRLLHNLTVAVDNVFDKEYRNHLSRVKSVMPEAGRNVRGIYRLYF